MVVNRIELDDHVLVRLIVADPIDKAAACNVLAAERFEIDGPAIFDVDGLGLSQ
jgi:hypothetical protein